MTYTQIFDALTGKASTQVVMRDSDNAFIPFDDGNKDYQEYKKWLADGNTPNPPKNPLIPGVSAPRIELPEPMDPAIKQYIDDQLDQLKGG